MTETRAALFRHIGPPLSMETIILDPPDPTEVQVQVRAVGLCHTELHVQRGVLELTGGLGVDHSFVCAGPVAMTGPALRSTITGGGVVVTGAAPADASAIEIPPADLLGRRKSLMGSVFGSFS
ncbi:zinc-binding dehydrogenase [Streptomyces hokutonensis]|uniref:zinc-binding dehydrogenase n=1 Tax=Streptomyces hokutonensis TaxID=1306990 RepID=UPI000377E91E|nr:zinc-binding dehydrogenase [Streptomyces hokutonensis]